MLGSLASIIIIFQLFFAVLFPRWNSEIPSVAHPECRLMLMRVDANMEEINNIDADKI